MKMFFAVFAVCGGFSAAACAQTQVASAASSGKTAADTKANGQALAGQRQQPARSVEWIYTDGTRHWPAANDMSYGNYTYNFKDTKGAPTQGRYDLAVTGTNGGWQPGAPNGFFDTTGYNFVLVQLKPTQPGNSWISGFMGARDTEIPGARVVDVARFCDRPFTPGQWSTCRIPLHAGGYNLPVGQKVYKVMFQEQAESVGTNTWYVNNVGLSQ